jgi:hypothetical protein
MKILNEQEEIISSIYFGLTSEQLKEAERRSRIVTWRLDFTVRRDVMFKKYISGKTFKEIGHEHGISGGRVSGIYYKTCNRLELMLSDDVVKYARRSLHPNPYDFDFSDMQSLIDGIWFHYMNPDDAYEYKQKLRVCGNGVRQLLNTDVFMSLDENLK